MYYIGMKRIRTKKPQKRRSLSSSKTGPKSSCTAEVCDEAYRLCLLGSNNEQLAEWFGKDKTTIGYWYRNNPRFKQAVDKGRKHADGKVAEALYHAALGYEHRAVKFFKIPVTEKEYDDQGNVIWEKSYTKIKKVPYTKKYKPDTKAIIKFLGVRNREDWGESYKVEHEHSHLFAGDVNIHHLMEQVSSGEVFTDEELELIAKLGLSNTTKQITNGEN